MKDIALSSLARVLVIVFQLISIKLYTNYLGAEQLGIYYFLLSVSYSANALLFIPVDYYQQASLVKVMTATGGIRPILNFNGKLAALYICFSVFMVAISAVLKPNYMVYVMLVTALAFAIYVIQALRNTLNNLEYRSCVTISFIQEAIFKVLFFALLVQYIKASVTLLVVSWLISLVLTGCYLTYKANIYRIFLSSSTYPICFKEVVAFSYPFSIGAVCNWLQLQGYRLILVPLGFAEEVGIFSTLSGIGSAAIGAASLIYSQQFIPQIYKTAGQYTEKYLKGAVTVIISVAFVCLGLGEFMVKILTNPYFVQYWGLLMFGVITDSAYIIGGALVINLSILGHTKRLIQYAWVGLASMILCFSILYFTDKISIVTLGLPLLISQWIGLLYMYIDYKKLAEKSSC